jgi:type II secretory pathway pseudopilin PulG
MHKAGPFVFITVVTAILAAIAVPNLRVAWNRERQKRSMADMRTIATALEARATDRNSYAITPSAVSSNAEEFASLAPVSRQELERALNPKYIRTLPVQDGWGNEFEVRVSERTYVIRSRGSDDRFDADAYPQRVIQSFKEDLVFSNGNFIQYPEGSCSQ